MNIEEDEGEEEEVGELEGRELWDAVLVELEES